MRLIKGSSKDIIIEKECKDDEIGIGYFIPKDTFSIFDYKIYGEWPFTIPNKGIAMAYIINKSFEIAKTNNIKTCFIEALKDRSKIRIARIPGREIPIEQTAIPIGTRNRMVDLEIIFNLYLHPRSSLLKSFMKGEKDYREYGFSSMPVAFNKIPITKLSYTTKYDKRGDLPLNDASAKNRSRLDEDQWKESIRLINSCVDKITEYAKVNNLIRMDGKHEIFVDEDGSVGIADTFGNPEEDRYIFEIKDFSLIERFFYLYAEIWNLNLNKVKEIIKGLEKREHYYQDISKQFLRNWYIDNGWKSRFEKDKNIRPYLMNRDVINAYSNALIAFAALWSKRVEELIELTRVVIKPIEEVSAELFTLEELNRNGMVKV
ncbi:MAG: phosphoribosylaminoimidazolesuccinocarboxamide synthase [Candidatus Nitrosocaldaceae archaeon]